MKRFGYAADPLCAIACALYLANRFWWREAIGGPWLGGYFNDLLLIPAGLPLLLWLQRRLGVRADDAAPRWREIALHLVAWAVIAEGIMPRLATHATGDWGDLIAYGVGALGAGVCWRSGGNIAA